MLDSGCDNQSEGFEKEAELKQIWGRVRNIHKELYMFGAFMDVARIINPKLCEGAFEHRPCRRRLRYIGFDSWPEPHKSERNTEGHTYFEYGKIYNSVQFNGATYTIEGYQDGIRNKFIGCTYFEWLKDDKP